MANLLERVRAAQLEEARNESQRKIDAKDSDIASAKREKDEFIEGFDKETPALKAEVVSLKEQRTRAELEIERLTARVTQLTQKYGADGSGIFMAGSEVDFYIDERKFVVVDALRHYLTQACPSDSRRAHILKDILSKNEVGCTVEHELSELKVQFNGFRSLLPSMRATLAKLGFTIDESGSHVKLTWYDDARYTFTLPKSGSDGGRGGKNSYAAMKKLLF